MRLVGFVLTNRVVAAALLLAALAAMVVGCGEPEAQKHGVPKESSTTTERYPGACFEVLRYSGDGVTVLSLTYEGQLTRSAYDLRQPPTSGTEAVGGRLVAEESRAVQSDQAKHILESAWKVVPQDLHAGPWRRTTGLAKQRWTPTAQSFRSLPPGIGIMLTVPRVKYQTPGWVWYEVGSTPEGVQALADEVEHLWDAGPPARKP